MAFTEMRDCSVSFLLNLRRISLSGGHLEWLQVVGSHTKSKFVQFLFGKVLKVRIYLEENVGDGCFIGAESIADISASEAVADVGEEVGLVLVLNSRLSSLP